MATLRITQPDNKDVLDLSNFLDGTVVYRDFSYEALDLPEGDDVIVDIAIGALGDSVCVVRIKRFSTVDGRMLGGASSFLPYPLQVACNHVLSTVMSEEADEDSEITVEEDEDECDDE